MAAAQPPPPAGWSRASKTAARDQLLAARRGRTRPALGEAADACADHLLAAPEVRAAATVAAYVALGTEPGTSRLLEGLLSLRRRVLLPVLQADDDLDWGVYSGAASLWPGRRGLREPTGSLLGREAVAGADVVLVPGLAVDRTGLRLGRGGGSYDRALARVAPGTFTCVLLYPDEVGRAVPGEEHDRRVAAAASAEGITRF